MKVLSSYSTSLIEALGTGNLYFLNSDMESLYKMLHASLDESIKEYKGSSD